MEKPESDLSSAKMDVWKPEEVKLTPAEVKLLSKIQPFLCKYSDATIKHFGPKPPQQVNHFLHDVLQLNENFRYLKAKRKKEEREQAPPPPLKDVMCVKSIDIQWSLCQLIDRMKDELRMKKEQDERQELAEGGIIEKPPRKLSSIVEYLVELRVDVKVILDYIDRQLKEDIIEKKYHPS